MNPSKIWSRLYWEGILGPRESGKGPKIPFRYNGPRIFIGFVRIRPPNGPEFFETITCSFHANFRVKHLFVYALSQNTRGFVSVVSVLYDKP